MQNSKMFHFTSGLLYPAILGTFLYGMPEFIRNKPSNYQIILIILLLLHYVIDYLYVSFDAPKEESSHRYDYTFRQFLFDLGIITCLYLTINIVLGNLYFGLKTEHISLLLFATKVLALFWELVRKDVPAIIIDLALGFLYLSGYFLCSWKYFLISALLIDIITYFFCNKLKLQIKRII